MSRRTLCQRFGAPAGIGAATLVGLVVGLMGDGAADVLAAVGLALPLVAIGLALRR